LRPRLHQILQDRHAVLAGQEKVQDHELVPACPGHLEPAMAVRSAVDTEPLGRKGAGHEVHDARLVVDDQHLRHG
jgi:hypothetical protein